MLLISIKVLACSCSSPPEWDMLRMTKMLGLKLFQAVCRDRVELLIECWYSGKQTRFWTRIIINNEQPCYKLYLLTNCHTACPVAQDKQEQQILGREHETVKYTTLLVFLYIYTYKLGGPSLVFSQCVRAIIG